MLSSLRPCFFRYDELGCWSRRRVELGDETSTGRNELDGNVTQKTRSRMESEKEEYNSRRPSTPRAKQHFRLQKSLKVKSHASLPLHIDWILVLKVA